MTSELALWSAYRAAAQAHMTDKSPARVADLLATYSAWVRAYCPGSAETLIAEQRARLEAACAA